MANRFQEVLKVRQGEDVDDEFFNRRFRDLDDRLDPLERRAFSEDAVFNDVRDRVLARSEAVIAALRDQLVEITQLEFLTGHSGTERTLVEGQSISFIIDPADRALFAPGPWSLIGRDSTPSDYAIVRGIAYDRDLGQFDVTVYAVVGDPGPHHDWSIGALAGSTLMQLVLLGQGKTARDVAAAAALAASQEADATAADRIATGQDRQVVHDDRSAAAGSAAAASTSKDAAADSAALAQKWATKTDAEVAAGQGFGAKKYAQDAAASANSIKDGPVTSVDGQTGVVTLAKRTPRGNTNYTIVGSPANARDKVVALTAALTAPRTWTLPAAGEVPAGYVLRILDEVGGISATNTLTVQRAGATDTINGNPSYTLKHPYADLSLVSDGAGKWTYDVQGVGRGGTGATNEKDARVKLGIEGRQELGNAAATVPAAPVVALTAALTAPRIWTLPAANTVNAGQGILISDEIGGISATNTLTLAAAGADAINGAATLVLKTPRSLAFLVSNGDARWSFDLGTASAADVAANTAAIAARPTLATALALSAYGGNPIGY